MNRVLYVFAGANGSGKSTVAFNYREMGLCPTDFICPDLFVPKEKMNDREAYISAMQLAENARYDRLADGKPFSFETVLSTQHKLDFIKFAKSQGYIITAVYVITSDPEINLARIAQRVSQGGHDVPKDKVLSRYDKSMNLMFPVIEAADDAIVYNNSKIYPRITFIKNREGPHVSYHHSVDEEWMGKYILAPAEEKGIEIIFDEL